MTSLYTSGEHSDLLIRCQDVEFKTHKCVIASQGDFYRTIKAHGFQEGDENLIDLPQENAIVLEQVIKHLYGMRYKTPDDDQSPTTFHALVYAAGDFYNLPSLKEEAQENFQAVAEEGEASGANCCFLAAQTVYTTTHEGDRGLRDIVVNAVNQHIREVIDFDETNQLVLKKIPDLSYDLVRQRAITTLSDQWSFLRVKCRDCKEDFGLTQRSFAYPENQDWEARSYAYCPSCGNECGKILQAIN